MAWVSALSLLLLSWAEVVGAAGNGEGLGTCPMDP